MKLSTTKDATTKDATTKSPAAKGGRARWLLIALIIWALAACDGRAPPEPAPQNIRLAKLMTVIQESEDAIFEYTGRIEALTSVDLSFEMAGTLAQLPVLEGSTVAEGSLIASLDPTDFQLAVREAEVQLRLASQDLARKERVLEENAIAKSVVEDAINQQELQRVRLSQAKERLSDTRLLAPFDAYVSSRYFDRFVNVKAGEAIVRLHDLTRFQVVVNIPEALVATSGPTQLVRSWVEFSFAPGRTFDITYHENLGEADALAQTYEVSFLMDNPGESLRILPGMTASAKLMVQGQSADTILLPASALVPTADGNLSVWVFNPETSRVTRRIVEAGLPTQEGFPIVSGLAAGERIVVAGASQIQDGMQIKPL